jgi:sulfate adenylyltransferase subunit 1 (EFTu-like GTPase family)
VLPVGKTTRVAGIDRFDQRLAAAESGDAVTVRLEDDIDVSRGYMFVTADAPLPTTNRFTADICWMSDSTALRPRQQFWIKHTTRRVKCMVESLDDRLEIEDLERTAAGDAEPERDRPDHHQDHGASSPTLFEVAIPGVHLIDPATRHTVAAG